MADESEQTERLKRLQMADLGTARREYISATDDRKNISFVRIEEIEAKRQSNIPGTAEHKQAVEDRAHLNQWQNLHSQIHDTPNADSQLSDLMHGQSHRAHLNEVMRFAERFGAQHQSFLRPPPRAPKPKSLPLPMAVPMPPPNIPFMTVPRGPKSPPSRLASAAHGVGIGGTRGRGFLSPPPRAPTHKAMSVGKRGPVREHRTRSSSSSRESKKSRRKGFQYNDKGPHGRPTRPHQEKNFSGMMASPQQFLAQAQARRAPSLAVPTKLSLPKSIPAPAEEPASNPLPPHPQQGKQAQVEAALEKPKNEKTSPAAAAVPGTPTPASRKPSGQKSILAKDEILVKPAGSIKTSQLSSKESKSPDNTGFTPGSIDRQEDDSNSDNAPTKIEALTGVLLEIESTFDTADSPDTSKDPLSSPGIEQLTGLNFYVEPSQEDSVTLSKDTPAFSDVVRQAQDAKKRVEALQADLNASGGDSKFDAEAAEERAKQAWEVVETCYQAMQNYFAAVNSKRLSGMQPSSPQVYKLDPVNTSPETPRGIPVTLSQPVLDEIVNQPSNATLHTSSQPLADETINQVSNAKLQTPPKPLADSFKEYRSPPRTPSSQDSKEDMASEKSPPTPLRNRVLKAVHTPTQTFFKEWKMPPEEWKMPAIRSRVSVSSKEPSSSKEPEVPAIPSQENLTSNPSVTSNENFSTSRHEASTAFDFEGTSKALAESIHARKPSAEISTVAHPGMSSEKLGPKIFGPPLFVKPKKTAVTVSDDFNQSQRAVSNTFNESQAAVPKAQVRTVGPAPWPGFKALNSNVPGPAVKKTGSEPDPFKKLYPPSNISQDSKPSTPVSKMPRVIGPQPYQGPRK